MEQYMKRVELFITSNKEICQPILPQLQEVAPRGFVCMVIFFEKLPLVSRNLLFLKFVRVPCHICLQYIVGTFSVCIYT